QSVHQARCRWAALVRDRAYQADADLARALAMLSAAKLAKLIAFLHSPVGQRQRTNNHVERTNRRLRYFEKVRYKWRRRGTVVRFVVLALDLWRRRHRGGRAGEPASRTTPQKPQRCPHRLNLTT